MNRLQLSMRCEAPGAFLDWLLGREGEDEGGGEVGPKKPVISVALGMKTVKRSL